VNEVPDAEGVAALRFQASVDGFGGSVSGVVVEVGEHVGAAALQGSAELGQLFQPGGNSGTQGIDDRGHHGLSAAPIRVGMGGDDSLVDAPGHGDRDVAGSANTGQPGSSAGAP
jgi:hypothetical protein